MIIIIRRALWATSVLDQTAIVPPTPQRPKPFPEFCGHPLSSWDLSPSPTFGLGQAVSEAFGTLFVAIDAFMFVSFLS